MIMMKTFLISCVLTLLSASLNAEKTSQAVSKSDAWDYLTLAQFWPGTSCIYFGKEECFVPPEIRGWTIHGLWPSNTSSAPPEGCNDSMKFDYDEIKVLQQQLEKQWPNFNKSSSHTELWSHEWIKHGTCAYDLAVLQGELKFFNATLQLHRPLNTFGALARAKINPTKRKRYDLTDIFFAVLNNYGTVPQIVCCESEEKYYLEQIFLCYDKSLKLRDCPEVWHSDSMKKAKCFEKKHQLSLQFESEKPVSINSQAGSPSSYFLGCPKDGGVLYIPISSHQADMEAEEDIYENFMERIFLP